MLTVEIKIRGYKNRVYKRFHCMWSSALYDLSSHPDVFQFENVQYDNLIRVVKNASDDTNFLQFRVFCSFVKYTYSKFSPIGIAR